MLPAAAADPVASFVRNVDKAVPDRLAGVYLVGGLALGDFSARQSNLDVVAVFDPPLSSAESARLRPVERSLDRSGRPASVWHAGWDVIADGPSGDGGAQPRLETPLTRALLQEEAIAYFGPDWPVVAYDDASYRAWCRLSLEALATTEHGLMVMRRGVASLVLEAARLAQGVATGRVYSKSEGGQAAAGLVPHHFRRILLDAVGYRQGATASMYWGPFERKYDARRLISELWRAVSEA